MDLPSSPSPLSPQHQPGIRAIFYAEFDNIVGPKILYQAPEGYVSVEDFDDISEYMITKPDLCGKVLTVIHPALKPGGGSASSSGSPAAAAAATASSAGSSVPPLASPSSSSSSSSFLPVPSAPPPPPPPLPAPAGAPARIITFPVGLRHEKYGRNALLFSVGFVLGVDADARPFEPVLRKLGMALYTLEAESELLHAPERRAALRAMLPAILHGLNSRGECFVHVDAVDTIALKLFPPQPEPAGVADSDVPVRIRDLDMLVGREESGLDVCLRVVLPHIDGRNYVRAIAEAANVDLPLVRRVVQQLVYYGGVALVDIFQYGNIYATQPRVQLLLRSGELRAACIRYIAAAPQPPPILGGGGGGSAGGAITFDRVFRLYAAFGAGSRTCDVCAQGDTDGLGIDDRKFVTFGVMHGLLRRMHKYPVHAAGGPGGESISMNTAAAAAAATAMVVAQTQALSSSAATEAQEQGQAAESLLIRPAGLLQPPPSASVDAKSTANSTAATESTPILLNPSQVVSPSSLLASPHSSSSPDANAVGSGGSKVAQDTTIIDAGGGERGAVAATRVVSVPPSPTPAAPPSPPPPVHPWLPALEDMLRRGGHSLEEICCKLMVRQVAVEAAIDKMGGFVYVLKEAMDFAPT